MNRYTKVINMMESYFTKDFEKAKKGITKTREVKEETVQKACRKSPHYSKGYIWLYKNTITKDI